MSRIVPACNSISFSKSIIKWIITSSLRPGKPICDSNVPPSNTISARFVCTSKPISNRNIHPSKTVAASSISPIFGSILQASKLICAVNVCEGKPSSQHVVSDVCRSEPINSSHVWSSNFVSARDIRPSKTISASNVCPSKTVYTNYVRQSRSNCGSKVHQSKPTSNSDIHHKLIFPNHT